MENENGNEEANDAIHDAAYVSDSHVQADEGISVGLIDKENFVGKFENKSVYVEPNKWIFHHGHEKYIFISDSFEIGEADTETTLNQLSSASGSYNPNSQLLKQVMSPSTLLDKNDGARNRPMKAGESFIETNVNILSDIVKEAKEKYECLMREKAKIDREFDAQIRHLVADRARLQELLDIEKAKHVASQNELQELKSKVGEIFIDEGIRQLSEECDVFPGIKGSGVKRSGYENICSNCGFIEGNDNNFFNSVTLRNTEDTADCLSKPLGTTNNEHFLIKEMSQIQAESKMQMIKLLNQQEFTWKATEETIENLERRLNLLEQDKAELEDTVQRIQNSSQNIHNLKSLQTKLEDEDSEGHLLKMYTCIYESPVFEDFKRNIAQGQHLQSVKTGKYEIAEPKYHKDMEIKLLKEEIENLRPQISVSGEKTCISGQDLHDKAGAVPGMHESLYVDKSLELQLENPTHCSFSNGLANIVNHGRDLEKQEKNKNTEVLHDNATISDSMSIAGEDAVDKNVILDNTMLSQEEGLDSPVIVLHCSFRNILLDFEELEDLKREILENDAATLEGELHVLKEAVRKLTEICQNQEIKLAEFKFGEHLQCLQGKSYLTVFHDLYVNLLQDITRQLGNLKKELKMNLLQCVQLLSREKNDALKQQLEKTEAQVAALENCLEYKNEQIKDLSQKTKAVQSEIDAALTEKIDLLHLVQDAQKKSKDQKDRIKELFSINDELLLFAQGTESELNRRKNEIERARIMMEAKDKECTDLMQESINTRKEMEELKVTNDSFKRRYKFLKAKLVESEYEISLHDEAIERLTRHLISETEGQDVLLEEDEKLQSSLKEAHGKEQELEYQLRQSWTILQKLEDKLSSLESEVSQTRTHIIDVREQNDSIRRAVQGKEKKALTMQKEVGEIQCRLVQLEDEVMEKEGQISILRSYHPRGDEF